MVAATTLIGKALWVSQMAQGLKVENREYRRLIYPPRLSGEGRVFTAEEVRAIITKKLPKSIFQSDQLLDKTYLVPPFSDTKTILLWDNTNTYTYIPETRDCEDYGLHLAARTSMIFGVTPFFPVWSYSAKPVAHFFDFILTPEEELYVVEPQSDQIMTLEEAAQPGHELHNLDRGLIYGF